MKKVAVVGRIEKRNGVQHWPLVQMNVEVWPRVEMMRYATFRIAQNRAARREVRA